MRKVKTATAIVVSSRLPLQDTRDLVDAAMTIPEPHLQTGIAYCEKQG